jgi:hypothetical protein
MASRETPATHRTNEERRAALSAQLDAIEAERLLHEFDRLIVPHD